MIRQSDCVMLSKVTLNEPCWWTMGGWGVEWEGHWKESADVDCSRFNQHWIHRGAHIRFIFIMVWSYWRVTRVMSNPLMFCGSKAEIQYSLHLYLYVFTLAPYLAYRIFQLTSTLSLWGQSRSMHRMPLFGVPPGLWSEPHASVFLSSIMSDKPASQF